MHLRYSCWAVRSPIPPATCGKNTRPRRLHTGGGEKGCFIPGNPLRRERPAYEEAYSHRHTHETESGVEHCGGHVGVTLH